MKSFFIFTFFIFVFVSTNSAQLNKPPVKTNSTQPNKLPVKTNSTQPNKPPVKTNSTQQNKPPVKARSPQAIQPSVVKEIPAADWKLLTNALQTEDWINSARISANYLEKLKVDNDKKQLAQLRYFYLYALAGKILAANFVNSESDWKILDTAISNFNGKEFVLPPRRFFSDCKEVLNYICAVKNNERALRVTATNQAGTMIHSFDYVLFKEKISPEELAGKEMFLGGKLNRVEFNQDLSKPWVMRLFFENGFVNGADLNGK